MYTYNDVFVEELVRRQKPATELLIRIGIWILAILLSIAAFVFAVLRPFSPVLLPLFILGAWLTSRFTVVEFEYSLINGELDVDKITGKRRRKRILSVNCKTVTEFAPEADASTPRGNMSVVNASGTELTRWALTTDRERLIFTPSERLVDAIRQFLPKRRGVSQ